MNLRWLCGNFADPQYKLSRKEQMRLSTCAHKKHLSTWKWLLWSVVVIALPFVLVMKFVYDPLMGKAGYNQHTVTYWLGCLMMIGLVFWPWSAWMYRTLYIKPLRRAMREAGWDLCLECGYELRALPADVSKCPECGLPRPSHPTIADDDASPKLARSDLK